MHIGYLLQQDVDIQTPPYSGPAQHVREVVQGLNELGHTVRVLYRLQGRLWKTDDLRTFEPVTVRGADRGPARLLERGVRRVQYELRLPYLAYFESRRFAKACIQELANCDLLFERMSWFDYGGALAARRLRIPLILENNGDHLADLTAKGLAPRGLQRRLSVALAGWAVRRAAHIVVSGEGWREAFLQRWGTPAHHVSTVENGTILTRLLSREQLASFQETPRAERAPAVVYLGGFQPWQGVPTLLQAVARLHAADFPARVMLIGAGAGVNEAKKLVRELKLETSVVFKGRLTPQEYAPILAGADIGVAPYCGWPEFSGLKLFDYKAAGLAVIASGRDGHPPTLSHGETGWIVPPCDSEALTLALMSLTTDPQLRRRLGRAARLEAEQRHDWSHTVQQLEQLFYQALGRGPAEALMPPAPASSLSVESSS